MHHSDTSIPGTRAAYALATFAAVVVACWVLAVLVGLFLGFAWLFYRL